MENLDIVISKENVSKLANAITDCMILNGMTLEHLSKAVELVEEVYKKNATIKRPTLEINLCDIHDNRKSIHQKTCEDIWQ